MNLAKKRILFISLAFLVSFLAFLCNVLGNKIGLAECNDGTFIISIILMAYSLIAFLAFFLVFLFKKNFQLVISDRPKWLDLLCFSFPLYSALSALTIMAIVFLFNPLIGFVIFIFILLVTLLIGLFVRFFILKNRKEMFFIFNNKTLKILEYYRGNKNVVIFEIIKDEVIFDDASFCIIINNKNIKMNLLKESTYVYKKKLIIDYFRTFNE